jgi:hypothetical protein
MKSAFFWDILQHRVVITDVSVQPINPIFRGQEFQKIEQSMPAVNCKEAWHFENRLCFCVQAKKHLPGVPLDRAILKCYIPQK